MGRIARKKAASGIIKWIVILAVVFAALYFYLGNGDEKTSTSEPTREVIGVSVKPGQGYDIPKTQPKEDNKKVNNSVEEE